MVYRRRFVANTSIILAGLPLIAALPDCLATPALASPASDRATAFITATGEKLVAAINAAGTLEERRVVVGGIINATVDVNGVARFCLGRFWRTATPTQQQQYLTLFHDMLLNSIAIKLGDYRGVKFTVGGVQERDAGEVVSTVVERPNNPPTNIQWVVSNDPGEPKIVDIIAEGTSLRITQREDYASYLSQHGNNVEALLGAIRQQVSQNG